VRTAAVFIYRRIHEFASAGQKDGPAVFIRRGRRPGFRGITKQYRKKQNRKSKNNKGRTVYPHNRKQRQREDLKDIRRKER